MNMFDRFAKKYGSEKDVILPPPPGEDEKIEEITFPKHTKLPEIKPEPLAMMNSLYKERSKPKDTDLYTDPALTEIMPGKRTEEFSGLEDSPDEDDDSFEEGFEAGLGVDMSEMPPSRITQIMPGIRAKLSRNAIIKLCDVYYDIATF